MTVFNVNTTHGDKTNVIVIRGTVSHDTSLDIASLLFQNYDVDDGVYHNMAEISTVDHFGDTTHNGFGDFLIRTNPGTAPTSLVERMRVTCDGYVGIGTSAPTNALTVQGDISSSIWNPSTVLVVDGNNVAVSSALSIDELNSLSGITDNVQGQLDMLASNISFASGGGSALPIKYARNCAMVTDANGYANVISITATELANLGGTTSSLQAQLDGKQPIVTGAAASVLFSKLPTNVVVVTDGNGDVSSSQTTISEVSYLHGVTGSLQPQLNSKQATVTGALTSYISNNAIASRAMVTDGSGKLFTSGTTASEIGFVSGVTSGIQAQLNSLQPLVTGAATTIIESALPSSVVVVSDAAGKISSSTTSASEISYVHGVTSPLQTQLNSKQGTISGALTSYITENAGANLVIVADGAGKLATGTTTVSELMNLSGCTGNIQAQLNAQNVWTSSNVYMNNVYISSTTPTAALSVNGTTSGKDFQSQSGSASAPGFAFTGGNSNMGIFAASAETLAFSTNGQERARFASNGYLGVGTVPTAPLEVVTGVSVVSMGVSRYFNTGSGSALLTSANYASTVSIVSNSSVWVKNGWSFVASSDQRVKKNIVLAESSNVGAIFDSINLYTYGYIDDADVPGPLQVHGFIAQEVNASFPEAITVTTETIPNVYSMGRASWYDAEQTRLQIVTTPISLGDISIGDTIQYYLSDSDVPVTAKVLLLDSCTIVVDAVDPRAVHEVAGQDVFVYGKVVDDFLTLDKNKLLGICFGKVKLMSEQLQNMQTQIDALYARLSLK